MSFIFEVLYVFQVLDSLRLDPCACHFPSLSRCWLIHNEYRTSISLRNYITSYVNFDRENELAK